jgi:translation initiation factor IF-2
MSDDTNNKPTLTRKPLTLSRSLESGEVKQTFSHGRTNKVVVEVKRKKLVGKPGYAPEAEVAAPPPPPPPPSRLSRPRLRRFPLRQYRVRRAMTC